MNSSLMFDEASSTIFLNVGRYKVLWEGDEETPVYLIMGCQRMAAVTERIDSFIRGVAKR
jgi:hypothetical protein